MNLQQIKVIITGATGMIGEGVLLECLLSEKVSEVLMINRRSFDIAHPKLKELVVPDFMEIANFTSEITGYDACFYCAGKSAAGMEEKQYTKLTYDTTVNFAHI